MRQTPSALECGWVDDAAIVCWWIGSCWWWIADIIRFIKRYTAYPLTFLARGVNPDPMYIHLGIKPRSLLLHQIMMLLLIHSNHLATNCSYHLATHLARTQPGYTTANYGVTFVLPRMRTLNPYPAGRQTQIVTDAIANAFATDL